MAAAGQKTLHSEPGFFNQSQLIESPLFGFFRLNSQFS